MATAQLEHDVSAAVTLRNQLRYGRTRRDSVITAPRFANINSPTATRRSTGSSSRAT